MEAEKDFPQFRLGNVVREKQDGQKRLDDRPLKVRGTVTGFEGDTYVNVLWPATPGGATALVMTHPVEEIEIESESIVFLTKKLIAGEELAKQELGIEILNKLAEGKGLQDVKDLLESWDVAIPHRKFRCKVSVSFMAEGTYLGGLASVTSGVMEEGFRVNDDSSTEILVSMEDEEWGTVVLDDPYLTISQFEEVEQEKEQ